MHNHEFKQHPHWTGFVWCDCGAVIHKCQIRFYVAVGATYVEA